MEITEKEYLRIYAACYGKANNTVYQTMMADRKFREEMESARNRPSKVEPHKCRRDVRVTKIKGELVKIERRH